MKITEERNIKSKKSKNTNKKIRKHKQKIRKHKQKKDDGCNNRQQ